MEAGHWAKAGRQDEGSAAGQSGLGLPERNVMMHEGFTLRLHSPDRLVYQIFLSLGPADMMPAGLMCHQWQALSQERLLWKEQYYRYYPVTHDFPGNQESTSWYKEFGQLCDTEPCIEVQMEGPQ